MNSKVDIKTKEDHGLWYDNNIDPYKGLAEIIAVTLKNSLISQKISFVDVPYRHKTKKSFLKKIKDKLSQKDYSSTSMTDLAGIRVITLIEADVQKVCDLVSKMFNVHQADSVNKFENLGEEKVGYRSVHFVCDVGEDRAKMPEFSAYKGLCFEIQVRTALEHAWAEIEHDRGYKLGGKLPSHLNRRFKLLSGLLESADLEFNRLTVEIENYAKNLNFGINNNLDVELTTVGVNSLLEEKYSDFTQKSEFDTDSRIAELITELENFGVTTLNELDQLIKEINESFSFTAENSYVGFLRDVMLITDMHKYFSQAYSKLPDKWISNDNGGFKFLLQKYPEDQILETHKQYGIDFKG